MTRKDPGKPTVNAGPNPQMKRADWERDDEITGNVAEKGEDPSPDNRERGESSSKQSGGAD